MKIELTKIENKTVGYSIIAETKEEHLILGSIRNIQFFGLNDTALKYDGMIESEVYPNYVERLKYIQQKHQKH